MEALFAETSIGITDLKKNPSAVIRDAGQSPVVVLHHNKPSAYLVPAKTYEAMMDILDDLQIAPLVAERLAAWENDPDQAIDVSIEDLQHQALMKISASGKARKTQ